MVMATNAAVWDSIMLFRPNDY